MMYHDMQRHENNNSERWVCIQQILSSINETFAPYFLEWLVSLACELVTHQQFMKKVLELSRCTRYFLFTGLDRLMGNGNQWKLMGINNVPLILVEINGD